MNTSPHTTPVPEPGPNPASPPGPPARPLNRRQEKFCTHFALVGNAAEAARFAGYSELSAKHHGYRLLNDPRIADLVYRIRVNRAIKFGPVMAFTRLEHLFLEAKKAGDFRGAAHILTLQARLAGVESWMPPSAVVYERQCKKLGLGRGVFGPKGRAPFDNLDEQTDIAYAPPDGEEAENDDR